MSSKLAYLIATLIVYALHVLKIFPFYKIKHILISKEAENVSGSFAITPMPAST